MPKQHKPDQKTEVLNLFASNGGDIVQTHRETGIPERTIYRWRSELWQTWRRQSPPEPSPKPLPEFKDDLDALAFLRHKIMVELLNIANNFPEGSAYLTTNQRTAQLSQLLNRMMELDEHLKPYKPVDPKTQVVRILYGWDAGFYLRNGERYRGPFTPRQLLALRPDWRTKFGTDTRLEMYWGNHTFSILPQSGELFDQLMDVKNFLDDPCEIVDRETRKLEQEADNDVGNRRYGWLKG